MTHRRFQSDDAATIASWVRTPAELSLLDPAAVFPLTPGQIRAWAECRTRAVVFSLPAGGPLVGYCELQVAKLRGSRVGVWLCRELVDPARRGWGYGTACAAQAIDVAKTDFDADVILAWIAPQNTRSLAVAHRVGLRIVRTDRVRGRYFLRLEKVCNETEA
jgi:RimJ/RimL family protein N-acetyltransferase